MATGAPFPAADRPAPAMPVDLRPLTTSELIDRGFTLYRAHFAGFLLIALLCQGAPFLLSQMLIVTAKINLTPNEFLEKPGTALMQTGAMLVVAMATQIITFGFEVVITFYIADAYLGKTPSVRESLRKLKTCLGASIKTCLLNLTLISLTMIFPILAIGAAACYFALYPPSQFFTFLLFGGASLFLLVASLAPVLIVFMRLMVTAPAVALEGLSDWQAIKRSSTLVRYDPGLGILYWGEMRLSFLLLPLFVIELMLFPIASLPTTLHQINEFFQHGGGQASLPPDSVMILSQILILLASSFIWPLYFIAITLFYYDVRIRREGFDLEFMARNMEGQK